MKVGILTSTRADFGIYYPLLNKLFNDNYFEPELIVFGTHLSSKYGSTVNEIINEGFEVKHQLITYPKDDTPLSISLSISKTISVFSKFWKNNSFDLVFTLGDRYEMFAATLAGTPFNINFAHIHAGETTLGAIDNAFRHSISLMSKYLFVSTDSYKIRSIEIIKRPKDVFNVGALSVDNLKNEILYSISEFYDKFNIDLNNPTILTTFHPETINYKKNRIYIIELLNALSELKNNYQIIITMPNLDTEGLTLRKKIEKFGLKNDKVILVESFGMRGYLSCMKHSKIILGNSSSAFVEASYFPKWVINVGNRQNGRINTPNIISIPILKEKIISSVKKIARLKYPPKDCNIYGSGNSAKKIIKLLKKLNK